LPTPGNTGNPNTNVACEGFDYTYTTTFTELPPFALQDPSLQPGASYCVALFDSPNLGTAGPFTLKQSCLGSATGFVADNTHTISSPGPTTNGFPQTVVPGKEYVLVLYKVASPSTPPTVNPPIVSIGVGGILNVTIGGTGPFTVTGCNGLLTSVLNGNVLTLNVGALTGTCNLVVTGPGGSVTVPVTITPGGIPTVPPIGTIGVGGLVTVAIGGTGPFTVTGCNGLLNIGVLNGNLLTLTGLNSGTCTLTVTGPGGTTTVPVTISPGVSLTLTPANLTVALLGSASFTVSGTGPFTTSGCTGIVDASVSGNTVTVTGKTLLGACDLLVQGPTGSAIEHIITIL